VELDSVIEYLAKRPPVKNIPLKWEATGYTEEFFNNWAASPAFSGWEGDRPEEEEADAMVRAAGIKRGEALLDVCCGYGRHAAVFAEKYGAEVRGIDISRGLIAAAKANAARKGLKIGYEVKAATDISWKNSFDTAIIVNNSFSLIEPARGGETLEKIYRALKPGGKLFLDIDNKPYNNRYGEYTARLHNWPLGLTLQEIYFHAGVSVETNRDVTLVKGSDRIHEFIIFKRIYAADEIRDLLVKSGFKVKVIYGDWDLQPLTETSPKMLAVAVKE
jgi:ubiquinone/menaquinone biosynthesis C-methylase UbiE